MQFGCVIWTIFLIFCSGSTFRDRWLSNDHESSVVKDGEPWTSNNNERALTHCFRSRFKWWKLSAGKCFESEVQDLIHCEQNWLALDTWCSASDRWWQRSYWCCKSSKVSDCCVSCGPKWNKRRWHWVFCQARTSLCQFSTVCKYTKLFTLSLISAVYSSLQMMLFWRTFASQGIHTIVPFVHRTWQGSKIGRIVLGHWCHKPWPFVFCFFWLEVWPVEFW